ncbi:MAG: acyl transferase [Chitinophagaceae bacterium]|nr:acyl transferase [Chitinophagaceae bacterium]
MDIKWNHKIFNVQGTGFDELALSVFAYQYENNPIYRNFADMLHKKPGSVYRIEDIPFLPIRFFKSHRVTATIFEPELVFESSGTTATVNIRHFIRDGSLYTESFVKGFNKSYGDPAKCCIIGLLPSYIEKGNSSLVYMVNRLIELSGYRQSGFYLYDFEKLGWTLTDLEQKRQRTILIGVTYALIDFAEQFSLPLQNTIVMETGGMKGRKIELLREEVHHRLKAAFGIKTVHSEYGMTELLSQAYSGGKGIFACPSWMRVMVRDEEDPFLVQRQGAGIINVIDLANIYSCAFIATDDAGKVYADESFEVLGRTDGSDLRGCSLLVN